jgi:4'-phosphopantetheinyl transferase
MVELDANTVDLWVARRDECDPELLARYQSLLSYEEQRKAERHRFELDRRRYIVRRAVVRTVLSKYAATKPDAWQFAMGPYGRPYVVHQREECDRVPSFNLSHSGDLIVLGVTRDQPIGVDVEAICDEESMRIAQRFFTASEVASLAATPSGLRGKRFWELWTLKEAYLKARGRGLSLSLDSASFELSENRIRFSGYGRGVDSNVQWRFWQLSPVSGYVLAVCVRQGREPRQQLAIRRIVPLSFESVMCYANDCRTSNDEDTLS